MAKRKGIGIAAVNYPTGMNLGGDPSPGLNSFNNNWQFRYFFILQPI